MVRERGVSMLQIAQLLRPKPILPFRARTGHLAGRQRTTLTALLRCSKMMPFG